MNDEKLDMQSPNWVHQNTQFIAQHFPNCVTETADGLKVDFDLLKQELSADLIEGNKERYRLEWPGKREAIVTANIPTNKTLRPIREDSVNFDTTENLYIEGDNLDVLKLLQESYLGKIKMIYIDPPYNTGKDFVYRDNLAQDKEEYKEEVEKDEYNRRLYANYETDGRYHSNWLNMMYPRLKLARNLLTDDGVIFISIDDNEVHNLRSICDEVFGEVCFIADAIWRSKDNSNNDSKRFSLDHNHTLVYSRSQDWQPAKIKDKSKQTHFKNPDNDPNGAYFDGNPLNSPNYRENLIYNLMAPNGNIIKPPKNGWRWSESVIRKKIETGEIRFNKSQTNIKRRTYLKDMKGLPPSTLMIDLNKTGHNRQAKYELLKIMPEDVFSTPKPINLIKYLLSLANVNSNDIVLDFFSGSSTTAHSAMQLNQEDGGNRKHIQVQLPELTDEKSEAYKAGYKNICEIGKERIRRAGQSILEEQRTKIQDHQNKIATLQEKIQKEQAGKLAMDDPKVKQLEEEIATHQAEITRLQAGIDKLDIGFRVYRLDSSNMEDVYYKPQEMTQNLLSRLEDNVKKGRSADDLLAQVMLDWGLPLSLPIEQAEILGKRVLKVAGNSLLACFDIEVDEAFAKAIAKEQPLRVIFKDKDFKDDTAKTNVRQLLKQLSPSTEMKVL